MLSIIILSNYDATVYQGLNQKRAKEVDFFDRIEIVRIISISVIEFTTNLGTCVLSRIEF